MIGSAFITMQCYNVTEALNTTFGLSEAMGTTFSQTILALVYTILVYIMIAGGLKKLGDIASTNIQAVFDLILDRAEAMNIPKSDMPKMLFIVSDMEFNQATCNNTMINFEVIRNKYAESEYEMPTLVFWNVNSSRNQTPVTINDRGVILISGCSPVIFKYALSTCNGIMGIINNVTESDRYNIISY